MNLRGFGFLLVLFFGVGFLLGGAAYLIDGVLAYDYVMSNSTPALQKSCSTYEGGAVLVTPCPLTVSDTQSVMAFGVVTLIIGVAITVVGVHFFRRGSPTGRIRRNGPTETFGRE